jgi:hypothetical protein
MPPSKHGESQGFYRRGKPNAERPTENLDDFRAFVKVASDMQLQMERLIVENPRLGIRQDEVDAKTWEYLDKGRSRGTKTLENDLEEKMRQEVTSDLKNRGEIITHLALALAYLELNQDVNEDNLDLLKE